jgi:hypothetical protein
MFHVEHLLPLGRPASHTRIQPLMGIFRTWARFAILASVLTPLAVTSAFALPGEATAVIAHCGQPTADSQGYSPVTGLAQRDLIYSGTILHFEPMENGWSFTTAWKGHLPVSRKKLETEMPCFRDAIQDVSAHPAQIADPTITADKTVQQPGIHFGTGFLWLIFFLAVILVIFVALPSTRRRVGRRVPVMERRKPQLASMRFRRKRSTENPSDF